jgi:type I restriction enzyme M protein
VHKLSPNGIAGFVLANGSMSSNQSGEGEIRRQLVENDLVDCMIALPGQLFYTTQIPVCLWFLARNKKTGRSGPAAAFRDRRGETLFIDARKLGSLVDRTHRELSGEEIGRIAQTYHAWRGEPDAGPYADVAGFCKSAPRAEIESHGHVLTPGRYVGAEETADEDDLPFEARMQQLTAKLKEQFAESARLEKAILKNLASLGFTGKEPG